MHKISPSFKRVVFFLFISVVGYASESFAEDAANLPATGSISAAESFARNLQKVVGQEVTVHLSSGQSLSGVLASVGNDAVQIKKIRTREFYEALILISSISGLEVRAKN